MTIYEEIEEKEEDAKTQAQSRSVLYDEKEYYQIRADTFREVRELFDTRERPKKHAHHAVIPFYVAKDIEDFLPPERTK